MKNKSVNTRMRDTYDAQVASLELLRGTLDSGALRDAVDFISRRTGKIVCMGVGKSFYVASKTAATLSSLGNMAVAVHPTEALHGDTGLISAGDLVLAFSYSGESREVVHICSYLKKHLGASVVSITGGLRSSLAGMSDFVVHTPILEEGCPIGCAPMASVMVAVAVGDIIASGLLQKDFTREQFARFHPGGKLGLQFTLVSELMDSEYSRLPIILDSATVADAVIEIDRCKRGIVGVRDGYEFLGVLTDGDVRRLLVSGAYRPKQGVVEVMTRNPKVIAPSATLLDALSLMETHKITSLFVVDTDLMLDGGSVSGIIHLHDILSGAIVAR